MSKDTGGPAFPIRNGNMRDCMTLRDYFAAKAMEAIISATVMRDDGLLDRIWRFIVGEGMRANFSTANTDEAATRAYAHADAMMAERNK